MAITMNVDNLISQLNMTRENSKDVSLKDLENLFSNEYNKAINFEDKNAAQQSNSQAGELTIEQNADGTYTETTVEVTETLTFARVDDE